MIRAIAKETNRNLVMVPLGMIETNTQLQDILSLRTYQFPSGSSVDRTIFVLEEIDILCRAVHLRDHESPKTPGCDQLDLSGFLVAMDGIDTSSGRIIIMTTNCPEVLDPALIRPGRIHLRVHLTYLLEEQARELVNLFFPGQQDQLIWNADLQITPASLQEWCIHHETIDQVNEKISQVQTRGPPTAYLAIN
jgi:AAA+ superfamily predicted ATPase